MATPATTPDVEELFALGRDRSRRRSQGRERAVELIAGLVFLVVAVLMATELHATRSLQPATLAVLVGAYAITCRAKFDIADGYTAPTELVLVPMLFLLPTPVVPLVVCLGAALGRAVDYASGRTSIHRSLHLFADCWHAVGPALVLVAMGAQDFGWSHWPVYVAALGAQCGLDFLAASTRAALIDGTRPGAVFTMIAPVYALDAALAPIGLLVAFAAVTIGPGMSLLVLPLAVVLAVLSGERQRRVDQALELSSAYQGTAMLLGDVVEADDAYTGSHSRGVVELSLAVADRLGLEGRRRRNVEFAALLHDVGKIHVPNEIINKKGPLDDAEWEIMRRHTIEGERMLKRIGGVLAEVGTIVRASHEDFDGSGYPDGLVGERIPVEARIVTCCDAFSAMTTTRSYRKAMDTDAALAELHRCSGTSSTPRSWPCSSSWSNPGNEPPSRSRARAPPAAPPGFEADEGLDALVLVANDHRGHKGTRSRRAIRSIAMRPMVGPRRGGYPPARPRLAFEKAAGLLASIPFESDFSDLRQCPRP